MGVVIQMGSTRPKFNSFYDKFHALQILINDTEYNEIELQNSIWTLQAPGMPIC